MPSLCWLLLCAAVVMAAKEDSAPFGTLEWLYEAGSVDFDFSSLPDGKEEAYHNGGYKDTLLAGAKIYKDRVFVSLPRWSANVPITFGLLDLGTKLVSPFPDWATNDWENESADPGRTLYSVLGFEIGDDGLIYVLDQGKVNDNPAVPGSIKVVVFDQDGGIRDVYPIPEENASLSNSFVNDIVIDTTNGYFYIADSGKPVGDPLKGRYEGQLLVIRASDKTVKSFLKGSVVTNPNMDYVLHIREDDYKTYTGADGIALTNDGRYLYFCPLTSNMLYRIPTAVLRDNKSGADINADVETVLERPSAADGLLIDSSGNMFVTGIETYSVYMLSGSTMNNDTAPTRFMPLVTDYDALGWPDTLGTADGYLTVVSNNLDLYDTKQMFTDENAGKINFRIGRIKTGSYPYWMTIGRFQTDSLGPGAIAGIVVCSVLIVGLAVALAVVLLRGKKTKGPGLLNEESSLAK